MNRRSLPLNALRTFESAARHLSFTRAAGELGVTHGAVSRQIATLESLLGVRLFVRGQPIRLTTAGTLLFDGIAPSFDRIVATINMLKQDSEHHTLAVNAPPTFTMKWLIPRLYDFQRKHPNVEVRLSTGTNDVHAMKLSDYDLVIRRLRGPLAGFSSRGFLSGDLVAVCAPELLESHPVHSAEDIFQHRLIEAATNDRNWDDWFAKAGVTRPERVRFLRFEEMYYGLQAALEGLGITLVPSALVVDDLAAGRLVVPLSVAGVHVRDYAYVIAPVERNPHLITAFCAWLDEQGSSSNQLASEVLAAASGPSSGST